RVQLVGASTDNEKRDKLVEWMRGDIALRMATDALALATIDRRAYQPKKTPGICEALDTAQVDKLLEDNNVKRKFRSVDPEALQRTTESEMVQLADDYLQSNWYSHNVASSINARYVLRERLPTLTCGERKTVVAQREMLDWKWLVLLSPWLYRQLVASDVFKLRYGIYIIHSYYRLHPDADVNFNEALEAIDHYIVYHAGIRTVFLYIYLEVSPPHVCTRVGNTHALITQYAQVRIVSEDDDIKNIPAFLQKLAEHSFNVKMI
ncbi:MAG: hypothetical protein SGPRY_008774, partial [Prymnesium sp.]